MTVFAYTWKEADCTCEVKCSDNSINEDCPVCKQDHSLCQGSDTFGDIDLDDKKAK
ncbi:CD1107 family mobile element protein [Lachnospira multipara]|uniref:CD1107 family mobile element protein n=1 Tax=Lachnospira multipara TaxID=28051 RepID=UPI000AA29FBF|nr:DUF4366 domain-containing protein [Lachnospira multipara]